MALHNHVAGEIRKRYGYDTAVQEGHTVVAVDGGQEIRLSHHDRFTWRWELRAADERIADGQIWAEQLEDLCAIVDQLACAACMGEAMA